MMTDFTVYEMQEMQKHYEEQQKNIRDMRVMIFGLMFVTSGILFAYKIVVNMLE